MKLPAHKHLDNRNISYARLTFPPATEKGAANVARTLGYCERQMIKTLVVFETKQVLTEVPFFGHFQAKYEGLKQTKFLMQ